VEVVLPRHGVAVFESFHSPQFTAARFVHPYLKVLYVLTGRGYINAEHQKIGCAAGDVIVIPKNLPHELRDDPQHPLGLYAVCVGEVVMRVEPNLFKTQEFCRFRPAAVASSQIRSALRRMLHMKRLHRRGDVLLFTSQAMQILAVVAANMAGKNHEQLRGLPVPNVVSSLLEEIERNGATERWTLDEAAAAAGMSRRRFSDTVRKSTGQSWAGYVRSTRIRRSKQLLLSHPARSVTVIAFETGFDDLSTFYRALRRQTGTTPQLWRRKQSASATVKGGGDAQPVLK
jgi:AraC family L-rhamnose operon regulatory protein RhaS